MPIEWLKFVELPEEVLPHVHFLLMAAVAMSRACLRMPPDDH